MAHHWKPDGPVRVTHVLDRGNPGAFRDKARAQWREHGANLVPDFEDLGNAKLDGMFVCCGKNGDDLPVITSAVRTLRRHGGTRPFLCHMSTVSVNFVEAARRFCERINVEYVNYPLTGGAVGAEKGTMLILASGPRETFARLEPALRCLGNPKHFGEHHAAGAEVKLIGQTMVFNGLIGICSAAALHSECFQSGTVGGERQAEFFDFLNAGAGGTRQWDVILSFGVKRDVWDAPFSAGFAAVDALYAAKLCAEKRVSELAVRPLLEVASAFAFLVKRDAKLATHAIMREMVASHAPEFDGFIARTLGGGVDERIARVAAALPPALQASVRLDVGEKDFTA
jgi:3-hydroxyisobutyrate dehydrogenase